MWIMSPTLQGLDKNKVMSVTYRQRLACVKASISGNCRLQSGFTYFLSLDPNYLEPGPGE